MWLLHQYKQVLKLQYFRARGLVIVMSAVQVIMSLGIAIGYTYLYSDIDSQSLLYLATGAPIIVILITGLVVMPMQISTARAEGHGDFLRTLPVNRSVIIASDATIWLLVTMPGIIIATLITHIIYQPGFDISIWVVFAYLLCILTSIGIGYGISYALPAMVALSFTQALSFIILMFSPINFPASRLPMWLQVVHDILPIDSMSRIMRASFANGVFEFSIYDVIKVLIWCVLGYFISIKALNKT